VAPRLNELPGKPGIQAIVSSRPAHEARGVRDADRLRPWVCRPTRRVDRCSLERR